MPGLPTLVTKVNRKSFSARLLTGKLFDELEQAAALRMAQKVRDEIRNNAPVETGEYRASWKIRPVGTKGSGVTSYSVFTDEPQAKRLEYGFNGIDALGRFYSNPAQPHVEPAVAALQGNIDELGAELGAIVSKFL